ncbi:MAG: deoxyribose-phosphate aldolase [Oscillibacter sp.]|nr:deoxyribose-phosphate aldolase [Oscillibacter sp.]
MEAREVLKHVDHTELMQTAKWEDIQRLCDDAVYYNTASICIPPAYVKQAAEYLGDKMAVCTVIGFPHGYNTTACKVFEVKDAIANGAKEVDMVINIGWAKDGKFDAITEEIKALKEAAGDKILKVIIETGLLTDEEKIALCKCVTDAGADFIKTCTGFGGGKATVEDIALFKANIGPNVKMKASSGMTSLDEGAVFVEMGCERLGSKLLVNIAKADGVAVEGGY